jgi:hypothetical protein
MPWAGGIIGNVVSAQMIEKVVVGGMSPEEAWEWAVGEMQQVSDEWKAEHPDWEPNIK